MPPTAFLIQWLVTWIILAVVFYAAAEFIQRALYEVTVEKIGWRVMAVTPLLAAALVKCPLPFQEMFFNIPALILQALLWFVASWLALRFQWQHAAAAGFIAVVTIAPVTSSSVETLTKRYAAVASAKTTPAAPVSTPASPDAGKAVLPGSSTPAAGAAPASK